MSTKQTSSEVTSPQKVKKTAIGLAMHSRERAYIVDSSASVHVMVFLLWITERRIFDNGATFWIFRPPMALLSHTRQRKSTSRSLALAHGYICWQITVRTVVGKNFAMDFRGRQEENSQILKKVRKLPNATSKKLRPMVAVPQYHPVNVREPRETLSENKKWRTTHSRDRRKRCISSTPTPWGHSKREVVWEQSLDDQFPSVVTYAGRYSGKRHQE